MRASSRRFEVGDVVLGVGAADKATALARLAEVAAERGGGVTGTAEAILAALRDREGLGSTALGRGVALPHARLPGDPPPLILLARLLRPVDWGARDDEPVDLLILVLWPDADADGFLPALSSVCGGLRDPRTLRRLRAAASPGEAAAVLNEASDAARPAARPESDPSRR